MISVVGKCMWLYKVFPRGVISTSPSLINGVVVRFVGGELVGDMGRYPNFCEVCQRCGSGIAPRK